MPENNSNSRSVRSITKRFFAPRQPNWFAHLCLFIAAVMVTSFLKSWFPSVYILFIGASLPVLIVDIVMSNKARKRRRDARRSDEDSDSDDNLGFFDRPRTIQELIKPAAIAFVVCFFALLLALLVALNIGSIFGAIGHNIGLYGVGPAYVLKFFFYGLLVSPFLMPLVLKPSVIPTQPRVNRRPDARPAQPQHANPGPGHPIQVGTQQLPQHNGHQQPQAPRHTGTGNVDPTQVQPPVDASGYAAQTWNVVPANTDPAGNPVQRQAGYPTQQQPATTPNGYAHQGWTPQPPAGYYPQQPQHWSENHPEIPAFPQNQIPSEVAQPQAPTYDPREYAPEPGHQNYGTDSTPAPAPSQPLQRLELPVPSDQAGPARLPRREGTARSRSQREQQNPGQTQAQQPTDGEQS